VTDLIKLLINAGASRAETDRSHSVCTVSSGIVSLGIPGLPDMNSNVPSMRRMLYSGNSDILTIAELLIGGKHSQTVLDCFLTCRDSECLREQLRSEGDRGVARDNISVASKVEETTSTTGAACVTSPHTRGYWEIDSVALMLGDLVQHNSSAPTATGRALSSATPVPSLLHRAYLYQMLLSSPSANVLGSLLQAGADPSAKDGMGWTPDVATAGNHEVLHRFANGTILLSRWLLCCTVSCLTCLSQASTCHGLHVYQIPLSACGNANQAITSSMLRARAYSECVTSGEGGGKSLTCNGYASLLASYCLGPLVWCIPYLQIDGDMVPVVCRTVPPRCTFSQQI
jgi:hypothetical protein